jgi:hypothetical protein
MVDAIWRPVLPHSNSNPDYQFVEHLLLTYTDYVLAKTGQVKIILCSIDKNILRFGVSIPGSVLDVGLFDNVK